MVSPARMGHTSPSSFLRRATLSMVRAMVRRIVCIPKIPGACILLHVIFRDSRCMPLFPMPQIPVNEHWLTLGMSRLPLGLKRRASSYNHPRLEHILDPGRLASKGLRVRDRDLSRSYHKRANLQHDAITHLQQLSMLFIIIRHELPKLF